MFVRIKKSGKYQYLQIVENRKEGKKVKQRVIATVGRIDQLHEKDQVEKLIRSFAKYSERVLLILSGKSEVAAESKKIGPSLIFERLWKDTGIKRVLEELLAERNFEFDVERAIFLTVLHRLMVSGSDRYCSKWRRDYIINGVDELKLHHLYRAMAFLGDQLKDQKDALPFSPRCMKDLLEEKLFFYRRDLFSQLNIVFFDTTSIYFEGAGGVKLGQRGYSKDHRPDLNQMVVGAILDEKGRPICCEMWPGNTADVKTLIPVTKRIQKRFKIGRFCVVADRGMISSETLDYLGEPSSQIDYILGARMRRVNEIKEDVLSRGGRYREVHPEGVKSNDPSPLKVKEVLHNGSRYIVCLNTRQARKDALDREAIVNSLKEQLKKGGKSLVGNKGYKKYLKVKKGSVEIDLKKVEEESRYDGKWVLKTNTKLSSEEVALKYKELWQVERIFRDAKSMLETRPVYHQRDETIRGHVFCSFLALVVRKELERRLRSSGHNFEWSDIKQDLSALEEIRLEENNKQFVIRSQCVGTCGKIFQAVGVALPSTIREI